MIKLAHVSFSRPIPIPGTHERLSEFSEQDGWTIEDDDGRTWLTRPATPSMGRPAVRFYTYVNGSCLPVVEPPPADAVAEPATVAATVEPVVSKGKRKR